jgi:single-strand DNA-binding protein
MSSLNKVMVIGNLGKDPEVRFTASGQAVASMNIATHERWTDKDNNPQERTEWHRVTVWGRTGENCGKYLSKGRQVYVEGRLQTRQWEDKEGNTRYTTEIVANNVVFLQGNDSRGDYNRGGGSGGSGGSGGPGPNRGGGGGGGGGERNNSSQNQAPPKNTGFDDSFNEDDIPF